MLSYNCRQNLNISLDPNLHGQQYFGPIFLEAPIFLEPKFFGPTITFRPILLFVLNFFYPEFCMMLFEKFVTKYFFNTKIGSYIIFVVCSCSFSDKKLWIQKIFHPKSNILLTQIVSVQPFFYHTKFLLKERKRFCIKNKHAFWER